MKIVVLMIVYDRWRNADRWRRLWKAHPRDETLCVVQNMDGACLRIVEDGPIISLERQNVGMDLGVFQDAVKGRLPIPEWDWLFVAPDDFLPMDVEFLRHFRTLADSPNVALVGSRLWHPDGMAPVCRSGGFMIRRDAAERLQWPRDPMTTKDDCHDLETRTHHMLQQVLGMGFEARFLPPSLQSIIWDTHHESQLNRWREFPVRDMCDLFHYWGTDKSTVHSYCDVYSEICRPFRQTTFPILELGVHTGVSLLAWRDYFPNSQIHGIDINPAAMIKDQERITTHCIDTCDPHTLSAFAARHGPFQMIVDDASHVLVDMLQAYAVLGSFLTDDGIYVIEDVPDPASMEVFERMPDATCLDRRAVKGRFDDIMILLNKSRRLVA